MRIASAITLIAALILALAACDGERDAVTGAITPDGDQATPTGAVLTVEGRDTVTGVITFDGDQAIPAGAVLRVELRDVTRVDASSILIASQTIDNPGRFPIDFSVPYEPDDINPRSDYGLQIDIYLDNQLLYINDTAFDVITKGNPASNVETWVIAVGGG